MGDDDEVDSFAFHVGGDDTAAAVISEILKHLNLRAVDSGTGDFFDHENAAKGLKKWRAYRDWVIDSKGTPNE
jgi:hypothetical protein